MKFLSNLLKKMDDFWDNTIRGTPISHYTPSGRLCPYDGMTDDELDDFEAWEKAEFGIEPLSPNPRRQKGCLSIWKKTKI